MNDANFNKLEGIMVDAMELMRMAQLASSKFEAMFWKDPISGAMVTNPGDVEQMGFAVSNVRALAELLDDAIGALIDATGADH
jgi:hypothetical protein